MSDGLSFVVIMSVCGVGVVAAASWEFYARHTGTPMRRRGGEFYTPKGQTWAWVVGVERRDGTRETQERESATWYEVRTWAERESSRYGNRRAWVRRAAGRGDQVKIWTWRNGRLHDRRKLHLSELEADPDQRGTHGFC